MGRIDGSAFGKRFDPMIKDGRLKVLYVRSNKNLFKLLARNRVDFIPEQLKSGYDTIDTLSPVDKPESLTHNLSIFDELTYHLLVSKHTTKGPHFVEAFNRGVSLMQKDGTLANILIPLMKPNRFK